MSKYSISRERFSLSSHPAMLVSHVAGLACSEAPGRTKGSSTPFSWANAAVSLSETLYFSKCSYMNSLVTFIAYLFPSCACSDHAGRMSGRNISSLVIIFIRLKSLAEHAPVHIYMYTVHFFFGLFKLRVCSSS